MTLSVTRAFVPPAVLARSPARTSFLSSAPVVYFHRGLASLVFVLKYSFVSHGYHWARLVVVFSSLSLSVPIVFRCCVSRAGPLAVFFVVPGDRERFFRAFLLMFFPRYAFSYLRGRAVLASVEFGRVRYPPFPLRFFLEQTLLSGCTLPFRPLPVDEKVGISVPVVRSVSRFFLQELSCPPRSLSGTTPAASSCFIFPPATPFWPPDLCLRSKRTPPKVVPI